MNLPSDFDVPALLGLCRHLSIVHHLPGRVRLRFKQALWGAAAGLQRSQFKNLLDGLEGIRDVRVNAAVASAAIEYAPQQIPPDDWEIPVRGDEVQVGEAVPADGQVVAGSEVKEGRTRIEAQRVASFIQSSLENCSETQRMAEELADKWVWFTLVTDGLVYALTRDLTRLESVFLVDYSCALKLGTPMAFKSGMVRAASHGVLMRGGSAIEHLAEVDGKKVVIGSRHFLEEHHGISFARHEAVVDRLQDEGKTLLYVGAATQGRSKGGPIGVVALRADAAYALKHLRALGITRMLMLTGDKRAKAEGRKVAFVDLHHTPGRLRIKGSHFHCHGERARRAVAALQAMKGVEGVQLNAHAGSLTVHYDPALHTQAAAKPVAPREGMAGAFGKALVGVLAQRTAT